MKKMPRQGWVFATVLAVAAIIISYIPKQEQATPTGTMIPGRNNTALFISNAEFGQLNVFLASAQALLFHHPDVEIHLATFGKRAKEIASINKFAKLRLPNA